MGMRNGTWRWGGGVVRVRGRTRIERREGEVAKTRLAHPRRIESRPQHQEAATHLMGITRHFHAALEANPWFSAIAAGVTGDDIVGVGSAHPPHFAVRRGGSPALGGVGRREGWGGGEEWVEDTGVGR